MSLSRYLKINNDKQRLSDKEVAMLEAEADQLGFGFDGAGFKKTSEKFVGYGMEKWRLD